MRVKQLAAAACLAAAILACLPGAADAAPVRWRSATVHVQLDGKDLKDVLRDFAASQGIAASIAQNVQGTVTGRFDLSPQRFLDTLASTFGFIWFYDGNVLSISSSNDVTRQVLQLDHSEIGALRSTLKQIGLDDPRFPLSYDSTSGTVLVSGPAQYVQMIADVAARLDATTGHRSGSVIRIYKLKNAWATDHSVQVDGSSVSVPGVATILANMYSVKSGSGGGQPSSAPNMQRVQSMNDVSGSSTGSIGGGGNGSQPPPLPPSMMGSQSVGSAGQAFGGAYDNSGGGGYTRRRRGGGGGGFGDLNSNDVAVTDGSDGLPVIQPDPITNSVLIRDTPDRVGQYEDLIRQLDVRPQIVEIQAHIIEMDDTTLQQIGVDWHAHSSHLDFQTGNGQTAQNSFSTGQLNPTFGSAQQAGPGNTIVSATPTGAAISAVVGGAGRYLLASVNALQSNSKAKIDATPLVATLDNVEATMDNTTKFYVRVQGYTSADLYSVSTGVSLRVLPLIVRDKDGTRIKLSVHIENGSLTQQQVDNIPVITTSQINTQAFVGEGDSLLIAGFTTDKTTNGVTGVPFLSKIPLLGALFRDNSNEHDHNETVFLLTPRIIDAGS
ncbi:type III secretion system outer membrane ring subunit SctC [Burkholderia plantarii]|uniref:Type 3 secretion system secretin n=1 Tax=Burkholderia plantarii TaxID=41899 RepID=A0A0B6RSM4_BURPL|nr:type III secretion system outer membrane ring subunit SctC [Burkholderia plantarii]AJK48327.1 type III secretion system outer membrane pore, YscC/HrcC family [Burkholderia plantarii]ALK32543.1 type III secretion outer membrane pore SctC [Burkholderia plantarii]WLE61625.1 type III secretion system outer membrane ring subunit SctC [Burkholderia plantarii]GLZ19915.1 EscC/YscC/HrcC family type III secretion system outer membrane ring protein [Burkholderia plantarii]